MGSFLLHRGPKGYLGAILDVTIFYCFFFQNWLEMTQVNKIWIKNNFLTTNQPRAGSEGHFYEGPRAILGLLWILFLIMGYRFYFTIQWGQVGASQN